MLKGGVLALLTFVIVGIVLADWRNQAVRRRRIRYGNGNFFYKVNAVCPVRNKQRFVIRYTPNPVSPNPKLSSKRVILMEISSKQNFQRNTDVRVFQTILKNNGLSKMEILDFVSASMKYNLYAWGIDFTSYNLTDVLKQGGIVAFNGSVRLETRTFSEAAEGKDATAKAVSETSNKFCRTFNRQPVDATGIYTVFMKDFKATSKGVTFEFKAGFIISYLLWFIPGCNVKILSEQRIRGAGTEDPKKPNISLRSAQYDVYTGLDRLGWGDMKIVRTVDADKGNQQTGSIIFTWEETSRERRRNYRIERNYGRKNYHDERMENHRGKW